jgi:hypothetical protein
MEMFNNLKISIMIAGLFLIFNSCSPLANSSTQASPQLLTSAVQPTPLPSPTEQKPSGPRPNATYAGPLIGLEKTAGGMISLKVSSDGSSVETVSLMLMDVKCEHFSTGLMIQNISTKFPIVNGTLQADISEIGKIDIRFDEATKASGTIHIIYKEPFGTDCDMGQVSWLGNLKEETSVAETPSADLPKQPVPESNARPTMAPEPTLSVTLNVPPPPAPQVIRTVTSEDSNIRIVNDRVVQTGPQVAILGEIENNTSKILFSMEIKFRFLDTSGNVLLEKKGYAATNACLPGDRSPFMMVIDKPLSFGGYSLEATSKSAPMAAREELGVNITKEMLVGPPAHVIGWAEISGNQTVEYATVIGVFYDAEGKVVALSESFLPSAGSILNPGDRRPFSLIPSLGDQFDHYRLIVDRGILGLPKPADLEIQDVQLEGNSLKGKLHNPTNKKAVSPMVWAVFYDIHGELIDIQSTIVEPFEDLASGATAIFNFMLIPVGVDHYELFTNYDPEV